jgi:hypothetical protein
MAHLIATLLTIILVVGEPVRYTPPPAQDEATVTDQEKKELQEFAKRFVARLLKTRDLRPLIAEFFLNDFMSIPKQDYYEKVSPELYAKLSKNERVRLFVAQENLGYMITLEVMTHANATDGPPFQGMLPVNVARKLNRSRLVEGSAKFTTRKDLLRELIRLERAILEARSFLKRKNLEQSETFLRSVSNFEKSSYLGYRVRASAVDEDFKRQIGLARFTIGQKIFGVDTPILIQLIVAKDAGKLKILTLLPADGD